MRATWNRTSRALSLIAAVVLGFASQALADVVDYWRFEEGSGTNILDQTGLANGVFDPPPPFVPPEDYSAGGGDRNTFGWSTNVFNNVVPQTGESNHASFRFAPAAPNLRLAPGAEMNYGSNFTVEFFFNLEDTSPFRPARGTFLDFSDSRSSLQIYLAPPVLPPPIPIQTNSNLYASGNDGNGNSFSFTVAASPDASIWQPLTWHHFALVKDGTNCQVIIDQTLLAESFVPNDFDYAFATNGNYFIGKGSGATGFQGLMDEVRISNTALDPSQFLDAVPEPSTVALMATAGLLFLFVRRRSSGMPSLTNRSAY
jgi:hypothetical protein